MRHLVPLQGRTILFQCLLVCLASMGTVRWLMAQSTTGGLAGTVYDPAHAVFPQAQLLLKGPSTGAVFHGTSGPTGRYHFEDLPPGSYLLDVYAPGFALYESAPIVVELGRRTRLDVTLRVATAQATVQVETAVVPFMKLATPGVSTNFTASELANLPSDSRRWTSFALLSPGVVSDQSGRGLLSFRGTSVLLNNNTVDGADNNQAFFSEERGGVRAPYSISMGAVQEFQVNNANYSAEYGRAAGGVINTVTKSGANELHGEAFLFYRNAVLGATNPFTTLTSPGASGVFTTTPIKPDNERKQTGFALGGPIKRDRLFLFYSFDYEQKDFPAIARTGSPQAVFASPLARVPSGTYLGFPITCANLPPYSSGGFYSSVFQFEATQGACEVYDRLDMTDYAAGVAQYQKGLQMVLSLSGAVPRSGSQTLNFPKLDWQINDRNHASFAYNRMRWNSFNGVQTQTSTQYGVNSFGNDTVDVDWGVARLASFLTENAANEARFQYGRELDLQTSPQATGAEAPLANNQYGLAPEIRIAGGSSGEGMVLGNPAKLPRPEYPDEHRIETADTFSWVRGKHVLKFGGDWDRNHDVLDNVYGGAGVYDYTSFGDFIADYYHAVDGLGPPAPVYYVDAYTGFSQSFGTPAFYMVTHDIAGFFNDEWRVHPRLVLTLGMRYEYERVPRAFLANPQLPQTYNTPDDRNNLGPRAGLAWDISGNGHTVVRLGAGVFYGRIVNGTLFSVLTGSGSPLSQRTYRYSTSIEYGAPQFPGIDFSAPTGAAVGSLPSAHFFQPGYQAPEVLQGEFTLEQQIGANTSVTFTLMGSLGRELPNFIDTNVDNATVGQLTYTIDIPGPPLGKASPLPQGAKYTTPLYTSIRPNYLYSNITEMLSNVNSNYSAGVFQLERRTWRGLSYGANYTLAHALDYDQNEYLYKSPTNILDPNNMRLDYGNSDTDVRQRLVLHGTWWPLWRVHGPLGALANNYSFSPIVEWQKGLPYTLGVGGNAPGGAFFGINGSGGPSRLNIFERNNYRFPATQMISFRATKRVDFGQHAHLNLMAETYNLGNHTNVTEMDTLGYTVCSTPLSQGCPAQATTATPYLEFNPTYGTPTNANSNAIYTQRQIQLAARLVF